MTPQQARTLVGFLEHPAVADAAQRLAAGQPLLELRKLLEQTFDKQDCPVIMDLLNCRLRYAHKFWQHHQWALSREPAEQATDSTVARWRSRILSELGGQSLVELGCGLGGDTVFLSHRFEVLALERSEARCILARYNLNKLGDASSEVQNREADCASLKGEVLFVDPARRDGARLSRPTDWQPPLPRVLDIYRQGRFKSVGVKCAPGLSDEGLPPGRLHFLSLNGQMKEAFFLVDAQVEKSKVAVLFRSGETEPLLLITQNREIAERRPTPGLYLHNPDPAILRADALDTLAEKLDAGIVHPKIGYLVGPTPSPATLADSFHIIDTFSLNWKALKKAIAGQDWSDYEYLGRGVPFSQSEVRAKLGRFKKKKVAGPVRGSVLIFRDLTGYTVVLANRVTGATSEPDTGT